jgi:DNA-3-methyladenine glycosylase
MLPDGFFARSVHEVAPELIGVTLLVNGVGGPIVEAEAYESAVDPSAHGFRGRTPRNASMFGPPGHAYVYRSYGIHWCLNLVCEEEGSAAAVLLRALEPAHGVELMEERRGLTNPRLLCAGPGRLCQALGVTRDHDGLPLDEQPFELLPADSARQVMASPRIGISIATDLPWRYCDLGSPYLSRPPRPPSRP